MNILHAAILGLVEGITEFLPISSTGHLMLVSRYLGISQTEFLKSFEIAIQSGAILAVVLLYWSTLRAGLDIWKKILTAFLPTAIIGLILYKFIKGFLLGSISVVLWSFFIGGIVIIIFERLHKERDHGGSGFSDITYKKALLIGLFQSIAVIPGVSRAAATIIGGLALGLKRKTIVEFSFLLAIPTMGAAMALDMIKSAHAFSADQFLVLAVGLLVSFAVALLAIRLLLVFIKNHTFVPFGIYRILMAAVLWMGLR